MWYRYLNEIVQFLFCNIYFRRLRLHWKELPHQNKIVILSTLLGATVLMLTLYTMAHTETVPITGRKRFIFITHDQMIKIVEKEVENVSDCLYIFIHVIVPSLTFPYTIGNWCLNFTCLYVWRLLLIFFLIDIKF